MKQQLLIDWDGKIPNLALMKVAAHVKAQGDQATLVRPEWKVRHRKKQTYTHPFMPRNFRSHHYDETWLSCTFTWNRDHALRWIPKLPNCHYGGTGFDAGKKRDDPTRTYLPPEIEWTKPDYSIYPGEHRAVGFHLRGCNRHCGFCDVPEKEGTINEALFWPSTDWCPDDFDEVLSLDNEVALFNRKLHDRVILDCANAGRKLSITQGYDIRTLDELTMPLEQKGWTRESWKDDVLGRAALLAEYKPYDLKFREKTLYIAWDFMGIEPAVRRGLQHLLDAKWTGREITCFTIVGYETEHYHPTMADYIHRHEVLWKEFGVHPFVMVYNHKPDPVLRAFARWTNRKIFKSRNADTFDKYLQNPDSRKATVADFDPLEAYGLN